MCPTRFEIPRHKTRSLKYLVTKLVKYLVITGQIPRKVTCHISPHVTRNIIGPTNHKDPRDVL